MLGKFTVTIPSNFEGEQYLTCPKCGNKYTVIHKYCKEPLDIEYALVRHQCCECVSYGRYKYSRLLINEMDCPKCGKTCRRLTDTDIANPIHVRRKRQKRTPRSILKDMPNYCECCGFNEGIQCHHIDGDHLNNDRANRKSLCESCHNVAKMLGEMGFKEHYEKLQSNPEYKLRMRKLSEEAFQLKKINQGKTYRPNSQLRLKL